MRGNHDRACSGLSNLADFNLVAAMSARWTQTKLESDNTDWLRNLPQGPLRHDELPGLEFVHGSPRDEDEYLLNVPTATLDFHLPGHSDVIFFGHTHLQGGFTYKDGKAQPFAPKYGNKDRAVQWKLHARAGRALPDQSGFDWPASRQRLARSVCLVRTHWGQVAERHLLSDPVRREAGAGASAGRESS